MYGHSVYGMNSVHGGGLVLRCTATIGEFYQEYKEIELGTPQKDPVPARGKHFVDFNVVCACAILRYFPCVCVGVC